MSSKADEEPLFDIDEISERLGVNPSTVWRWKRSGKIPFVQPAGPGTTVRFPLSALDACRQETGLDAPPPTVPQEERLPGPRPGWMDFTNN